MGNWSRAGKLGGAKNRELMSPVRVQLSTARAGEDCNGPSGSRQTLCEAVAVNGCSCGNVSIAHTGCAPDTPDDVGQRDLFRRVAVSAGGDELHSSAGKVLRIGYGGTQVHRHKLTVAASQHLEQAEDDGHPENGSVFRKAPPIHGFMCWVMQTVALQVVRLIFGAGDGI